LEAAPTFSHTYTLYVDVVFDNLYLGLSLPGIAGLERKAKTMRIFRTERAL
jgi:hypothetical protein